MRKVTILCTLALTLVLTACEPPSQVKGHGSQNIPSAYRSTGDLKKDVALLREQMTDTRVLLDELRGQIELMDKKISRLEDAVAILANEKGSPQALASVKGKALEESLETENNPREIYDKAYHEMVAGRLEIAKKMFNLFVEKYPQHPLADNAICWRAYILYNQKRYTEAEQEAKRLIKTYPEGNKVPDAMYIMGEVELKKGNITKAKELFTTITNKYTFTNAALKAKERLDEIEEKKG
jgi:tol-pal system protein YbgF